MAPSRLSPRRFLLARRVLRPRPSGVRVLAWAAAVLALGAAPRADAQQPDSVRPVVSAPDSAPAADTTSRMPTPAEDSLYLAAQRLVAEGQGAAGRAIVDSLLAAAPPDSPRFAEALFWRASLAATANEAERDYGRLVVEFPLSLRAEDALLRLAQLEIARGDRAKAIRHLDRLLLEHPQSPTRARTAYWLAYAQFEERNLPRACAALGSARASAAPTDVELRNQIAYYASRCTGVDTTAVIARAPTSDSGARRTTASRPPAAGRGTVQRTDAGTTVAPAPPASGRWTIQVAAFQTRDAAAQLRDRLSARGYSARVTGTAKLWRVRVGRYPTREAAQAAARDMTSKKVVSEAYVTEAEPQ